MGRKDIKIDKRKPFCRDIENHHRLPISLGGSDDEGNISRITKNEHDYWHGLHNNDTAEQIAQRTNERYLDPAYVMVAIKRSDIERYDSDHIRLISERTLREAQKSSK